MTLQVEVSKVQQESWTSPEITHQEPLSTTDIIAVDALSHTIEAQPTTKSDTSDQPTEQPPSQPGIDVDATIEALDNIYASTRAKFSDNTKNNILIAIATGSMTLREVEQIAQEANEDLKPTNETSPQRQRTIADAESPEEIFSLIWHSKFSDATIDKIMKRYAEGKISLDEIRSMVIDAEEDLAAAHAA